jgi:hypothetical protein
MKFLYSSDCKSLLEVTDRDGDGLPEYTYLERNVARRDVPALAAKIAMERGEAVESIETTNHGRDQVNG